MFRTDQPICAELAQRTTGGTADVLKLALLSAQIPFWQTALALQGARSQNWSGIPNVTALKRAGCDWIDQNAETVCVMAWNVPTAELMERLLKCPGLGLVKAGFAVQMLTGQAGCLDTHNKKLYNVTRAMVEPDYRYAIQPQIARYLKRCETLGGAEVLWDQWCQYVAAVEPKRWANAEDVSRFHWEAIDGKPF